MRRKVKSLKPQVHDSQTHNVTGLLEAIVDTLRCMLAMEAHKTIPEDDVRAIVGPSPKLLKAYNLCDGTRRPGEVAKAADLDHGNFSRTSARWLEAGVLFKVGPGDTKCLLHLYPLKRTGTQKHRRKVGK